MPKKKKCIKKCTNTRPPDKRAKKTVHVPGYNRRPPKGCKRK